jgi:hypothetical protein
MAIWISSLFANYSLGFYLYTLNPNEKIEEKIMSQENIPKITADSFITQDMVPEYNPNPKIETSSEQQAKPHIQIQTSNYSQMLLRDRYALFDAIYQEKDLNGIIRYFAFMSLLMLATYGACLGSYAGNLQILSSALKIPTLFFLTLAVCAPALFTFNVLLGSKLSLKQIVAMLMVKMFLIALILVSFAPIMLFFIVTASNHDFTTLLNVSMCGIAGLFGLTLLWKGMDYLTVKNDEIPNNAILIIWIGIYMFVGTQLAWSLRPFVGETGLFSWFREIDGNFYAYLLNLLTGFTSSTPYGQ